MKKEKNMAIFDVDAQLDAALTYHSHSRACP